MSPASNAASSPRVAVVTGGGTGIGKAICADLLDRDYEVVSLSLEACDIASPKLTSIEVDLTDRKATAKVVADVAQRYSPTTVIHNAGVIRAALIDDVELNDFDALVELHLATAVQLVQATLPAMRAAKFGRIVLMSSRAALGAQTRTAYSATKSGMIGMARTWALELARDGITVNLVAPGPIRTDMFHAVIDAGSERERALAASIPVGRIGEAGDVARAVTFLTDPQNSFVTGQVLYVCGGASLGSIAL